MSPQMLSHVRLMFVDILNKGRWCRTGAKWFKINHGADKAREQSQKVRDNPKRAWERSRRNSRNGLAGSQELGEW